jgi:putative transposase
LRLRSDPMRDPQVILRQKIKDYAQTCVRYGYQRIHILFEREGIHVNHKRVYRLYRIENLHLRKNQRESGSLDLSP